MIEGWVCGFWGFCSWYVCDCGCMCIGICKVVCWLYGFEWIVDWVEEWMYSFEFGICDDEIDFDIGCIGGEDLKGIVDCVGV